MATRRRDLPGQPPRLPGRVTMPLTSVTMALTKGARDAPARLCDIRSPRTGAGRPGVISPHSGQDPRSRQRSWQKSVRMAASVNYLILRGGSGRIVLWMLTGLWWRGWRRSSRSSGRMRMSGAGGFTWGRRRGRTRVRRAAGSRRRPAWWCCRSFTMSVVATFSVSVAGVRKPRRAAAGRGFALRVSRGCSVCRHDFGDGGAGGCLVDEVLAGGAGGDERSGGEVVDGAGFSAGGLVDLGDGVVGEEVGGAAGDLFTCLLYTSPSPRD